jgi:hypothetical protein
MINVKNNQQIAELNYTLMSVQQKEQFEPQSIKLIRRNHQLLLSTNDSELMKKMIALLKKICVLTDFNNVYHTMKIIGKGSFAKVYLVANRENNCQYAVKSFSKD